MTSFTLQGMNILVTGAAGILGRHFCSGLVHAGAHVIAVDLHQEGLEALVDHVGLPDSLTLVRCDVSDEQSVVATIDRLWSDHGQIHGLLNNAASKSDSLDQFFADFESSTLANWRQVTSVNLDAAYVVAREVGGRMANVKTGSIVQISSIYAVVGPDQRIYEGSKYLGRQISSPAVYSASKAGILGLTRFLATLWGEQGIRVNSVTPGGVSSGQNEVFENQYSERVPMKRMATERDIVGPVVFLFSEAASYITGQNLIVDGGLTAW